MNHNPIQIFDSESSTFTYLLVASDSAQAIVIDPVERHCERNLQHLERLQLAYAFETHAHADSVTSGGKLCALTGTKAAVTKGCGIAPAEVQLEDGGIFVFGKLDTAPRHRDVAVDT